MIKDNENLILETGFSLKQLHDYLEKWNGLMGNNKHLHETEKLKSKRQQVLTDACYCIIVLGRIMKEMGGSDTLQKLLY